MRVRFSDGLRDASSRKIPSVAYTPRIICSYSGWFGCHRHPLDHRNIINGYWFGEHPRGYFVYDATGHVHIQMMSVPPLAPFPEANSDDGKLPSAEHALAAYNAYFAYFGTYTVDGKKHLVTHHVEGSLAPDYTDTDQPRPFKLEGDRLEIGDGKTWRRVLERVR